MPEISSKVELLGNLIDYKEILKQSEEYKVDFDKNKINLIFLGRLDESSKKISKLIKTVNNSKELDKFNLYIIGEGPDKKEYENISKTENIIFVGEYQNPYPYIKAGDYLILTSKYEGFPVVYNEATVLKTGIITTIPVEDEQIIYNGNNIIKLNSDLSNFDKIIEQISKEEILKNEIEMNFEEINNKKMERFYEIMRKMKKGRE